MKSTKYGLVYFKQVAPTARNRGNVGTLQCHNFIKTPIFGKYFSSTTS